MVIERLASRSAYGAGWGRGLGREGSYEWRCRDTKLGYTSFVLGHAARHEMLHT